MVQKSQKSNDLDQIYTLKHTNLWIYGPKVIKKMKFGPNICTKTPNFADIWSKSQKKVKIWTKYN